MTNCPECGAAVYPQDNFCPECGQTLSGDTEVGRSTQQGQQEQATRGRQGHERGRQVPESGSQRPSSTGRGPATRDPQAGAPRGREQPRFSKGTLTGVSIVTALVAVVFLPPIFGAVSIYTGYKMYTQYDESRGRLLMGAGVVATIAGIALGAYLFVQM